MRTMIDNCEIPCKNYELCETNTNSHNSLCKKCEIWGEIPVISQKQNSIVICVMKWFIKNYHFRIIADTNIVLIV